MDCDDLSAPEYLERFIRQDRFAPLGREGSERLRASRVLICGCGALGTVIAERLARAGVRNLRIIDRDWVEWSNLPRQTLFTEQDAIDGRPKAIACADAIRLIDRRLLVEPIVEDLTCDNIMDVAASCDLIMDGTDNFETRFLINDYSIKFQIPWVHGGCVGSGGQLMSILPGVTACYRCLIRELPSQDSIETCDSAGVLGPAVGIIACWQAAEAIKILAGKLDAVCRDLLVLDSWHTACRSISLKGLLNAKNCPTCNHGQFPFLEGANRTEATVLCGKNAVQIRSSSPIGDLEALQKRLQSSGKVSWNGFFLRLTVEQYTITLFKDGRAVVAGTTHPNEAKNLLAKTIGG
jgi:molybdopterin-synthase adenylyltransferase